jgi:hypothetical protein
MCVQAWVIYCFLAILFETLGGEAAIANHVKDGGCPPVRRSACMRLPNIMPRQRQPLIAADARLVSCCVVHSFRGAGFGELAASIRCGRRASVS